MSFVKRYPNFAADWARIHASDPNLLRLLYHYVSNAGFRATLLYRCAHVLWSHGWRRVAACVTSHSVSSTGCEIRPEAQIGPGLLLHHPVGIVIGRGSRLGKGCTVLQNVTIGERYSPADDHSYPEIGDNVTICAGAVLLGGIVVGSKSVIGANSVVLADLPNGSLAVGAPARAVQTPDVTGADIPVLVCGQAPPFKARTSEH